MVCGFVWLVVVLAVGFCMCFGLCGDLCFAVECYCFKICFPSFGCSIRFLNIVLLVLVLYVRCEVSVINCLLSSCFNFSLWLIQRYL